MWILCVLKISKYFLKIYKYVCIVKICKYVLKYVICNSTTMQENEDRQQKITEWWLLFRIVTVEAAYRR
jgi:hypothetical protein